MRHVLAWILSALAAGCMDGSPEPGAPHRRILWRMDLQPNEIYAWRGIPAVQDGIAYWKTMDGLLAFDAGNDTLRDKDKSLKT